MSVELKKCRSCGRSKPIEEFSRRTASADGRNSRCRSCVKTLVTGCPKRALTVKKHRERNPDAEYLGHVKHRYGAEGVTFVKSNPNPACGICGGRYLPATKRRLALDHCHLTGRIRGFLCDRCNRGLGCFKDSSELLVKAANYLKS